MPQGSPGIHGTGSRNTPAAFNLRRHVAAAWWRMMHASQAARLSSSSASDSPSTADRPGFGASQYSSASVPQLAIGGGSGNGVEVAHAASVQAIRAAHSSEGRFTVDDLLQFGLVALALLAQ